MIKTVKTRPRGFISAEPVFRVPPEISDAIYVSFNSLAHRSRLLDGVAVWANRAIREESFSRGELQSIRDILTDPAPETAVSVEILSPMSEWIEEALSGRVPAQ